MSLMPTFDDVLGYARDGLSSFLNDGNAQMSDWRGLSEHLVATVYEVKKTESGSWVRTNSPIVVKAPVVNDATYELQLNWESPFEQSGAESKMPALMAMFQSGALQPILEKYLGTFNEEEEAQKKSHDYTKSMEGKTGITKLNSTQVFSGMPPTKLTLPLAFRAWRDPIREVERPIQQLEEWALPIELSKDTTLLTRAADMMAGDANLIDVLMPSKAPTRVAMEYKGRIYSPMVIESISKPLVCPIDKQGRDVAIIVNITLCSLTAIDRQDLKNMDKRLHFSANGNQDVASNQVSPNYQDTIS